MKLYGFLDESGYNVNNQLREVGIKTNNKIHMAYGWQLYLGKVEIKYGLKGLIKPNNKLIAERSKYIGKYEEGHVEIATMAGLNDLLTYLIDNNYSNEYIKIFMDNKQTVDLINETPKFLNKKLRSKLKRFANLKIIWFGRVFNGFADKLAKKGLQQGLDIKLTNKLLYKLKDLVNELDELKGSKYENKVNMLKNEIKRLNGLVKEKEERLSFYETLTPFTIEEHNDILNENNHLRYKLAKLEKENKHYKNMNKNMSEILLNKKKIIADDSPLIHLMDEEDQPFENL